MTKIIWRKEWQLYPPGVIPFNADGSVPFGDPLGGLFLPADYLGFMQRSEGAALRDRGSWFLARFQDGTLPCEIEWLGDMRNLRLGTISCYRDPDMAQHCLPPTYVYIGYAEPGPYDVVMNALRGDPDYGKVYVWHHAHDPWMTGSNTRGLGLVADSFTAFMNGLASKDKL